MLDPAYSDELAKIRKTAINDRNWRDTEIDRIEKEYNDRCKLHVNERAFIQEHPSELEMARRDYIADLEESGQWRVTKCASRGLIMTITHPEFPTTTLVATKHEVPFPNTELVGFTITLGTK